MNFINDVIVNSATNEATDFANRLNELDTIDRCYILTVLFENCSQQAIEDIESELKVATWVKQKKS